MAAYAIAQVHVTDENRYAKYPDRVSVTVSQYGGRYLVRGGGVTHFEEPSPYEQIDVIEFPDRNAAERWIRSPEFVEASRYWEGACHGVLSIVDGTEEEGIDKRLAERLAWAEGVALHSWLLG